MRINEAAWLEKYNRWQIKVQKDGVRKTFTSSKEGKKGKIECEKKADKWLKQNVANYNARFWTTYQKYLAETKLLTSTSNYKNLDSLGRVWLKPQLEHRRLNGITCQMWQDCINSAYKAGRSKKTLKNIRGAISNFRKYAKKCGYDLLPCDDLTIPKNAISKEKHILQPEDLKKLFSKEYNDNFYIHAFRFFVLTGLRRGELCALSKENIKDGIIHITQSLNYLGEITSGKNSNANRYFAITPLQQQCLDAQSEMLKDLGIISPYVFCGKSGKMLDSNYLFKKWKQFSVPIGINCTLHELRHTFISINQSTVPETLLKRVVGHSKSMDTFGIYGHVVDGDVEKAANMIDHTFNVLLSNKK